MDPMWLRLITTAVLLSCVYVACDYAGPPQIQIFPRDQTVRIGVVAVFVCTVTGVPNLQIKWLKNGREIHLRRNYSEEYYASHSYLTPIFQEFEQIDMTNGSVLRINKVKPGTFECVAGNGAEESGRATAELKTLNYYWPPHGFPQIARTPIYQWVGIGHRIIIPCLFTGDPKPTIRWLRNKLPLNMAVTRYSLLQEQFLQISDAKKEDEGIYECIAENSVGSETSTKNEVHVSESRQSPGFTIQPKELYTLLPGSSLNIICLANGSPLPTVKWREDSTDISPIRDGLNVLELTDIQGSHNYTCVASSTMGTEEATAQVVAQNYPRAPTNLRVSDVNATCAHLSWSYGTGLENLHYYTLYYKKNEDIFAHTSEVDRQQIRPYITLCELDPDTEYEFYVTAYNGVGRGPQSPSVFAKTKGQ